MEHDNTTPGHGLESFLGAFLRIGVLVSAMIVLLGGIFFLAKFGTSAVDHHQFQGEPENLRTLPGIAASAFGLSSRGIIQFGLLLLISTPILRVLLSAFAFAWKRDYLYVVLTLVVLALLIASLLGGWPTH